MINDHDETFRSISHQYQILIILAFINVPDHLEVFVVFIHVNKITILIGIPSLQFIHHFSLDPFIQDALLIQLCLIIEIINIQFTIVWHFNATQFLNVKQFIQEHLIQM